MNNMANYSSTEYSDSPIPVDSEPQMRPLPEAIPEQHVSAEAQAHKAEPSRHWQQPETGPQAQEAPPLAKGKQTRGTKFWVLVTAGIATLIIVVLAAILGAVASGAIKTSATTAATNLNGNSSSAPSSTASFTPTSSTLSTPSGTVVVTCPSANEHNHTVAGTTKIFRRQCDTNYPLGDGEGKSGLGLQPETILSMEACITKCALQENCVGAVFNYQPQCYLKARIGLKVAGVVGTESALLWQ